MSLEKVTVSTEDINLAFPLTDPTETPVNKQPSDPLLDGVLLMGPGAAPSSSLRCLGRSARCISQTACADAACAGLSAGVLGIVSSKFDRNNDANTENLGFETRSDLLQDLALRSFHKSGRQKLEQYWQDLQAKISGKDVMLYINITVFNSTENKRVLAEHPDDAPCNKIVGASAEAASFPSTARTPAPRFSRTSYVLRGVFLGSFGVHNFYAGYTKQAVGQLLLTLFSFFFSSQDCVDLGCG